MSRKTLLLILLLAVSLIAWQRAPVLSLTLSADPAVPVRGDVLTLTIAVENVSAEPLEQVVVIARVPSDTTLQEAQVIHDDWTVTALPSGDVWYTSQAPLAPGQRALLVMRLTVQPEAGSAIAVESYSAFAKGMQDRVTGAPLTLWIDATPTPQPVASPSPTATPVVDSATATAAPSRTPSATGTPVPVPSPTPSPTITVVMAVLAPTPTPILSSEQEQLGTLTISIFVGFTLLIAVLAAVWLIRWSRR